MQPCKLHIVGGSGTGTTTLGRAIADAWAVPHADSDDYFWIPTVPAYSQQRPPSQRVQLMQSIFAPRESWVLSGAINGWGEVILEQCDAVVFLTLDAQVRQQRIEQREVFRRAGKSFDPNAWEKFVRWSQSYDDPEFEGRSRARHEAWLATLSCPVLRLDSAASVPELSQAILGWEPTR